jgi:uncharacterized protein
MIEEAENFLKDFGINELRVRHFGNAAKIEVKDSDKKTISDNIGQISKRFNEIGFNRIEVANFKSGNLNVMISVRAEN